jgi:CoA:oxalate CoA-transferase
MSAKDNSGPLAGITIVDLTRVLAGPFCTMLLADLGARVIKVEPPEKGDDARHIGPFVEAGTGSAKSAYFMPLNRGKESIALDLKDAADKRIFEALLAGADVLVENYRPGVMEKLGYGWQAIKEQYPRLIYAAASGFGHTGPLRNRAAYDMVVQAMGGMMSVTGHPGAPPTRVGSSIGDITAGLFTATGINAALFEREKTGRGQKIDVAMLDCQLAILENAIARYFASGISPGPLGARHPSITPFSAFQARDGYLVIAAGNDALFAGLCNTLGLAKLAQDPRFLSNAERTKNAEALGGLIEAALAARRVAEWLEMLEEAGIPAGPINNIEAVVRHPQIAARNMIVTSEDPEAGPVKMAGNPIKMSAHADPATRRTAPGLDADREDILKELGLE